MPQIKVEKSNSFSQISNCTLQDRTLSFKARGLLSYMLSLPQDWDYSIAGLAAKSDKDGISSVRSGLDELIAAKYICRQQVRSSKGNFDGYEYIVYEVPQDFDEEDNVSPSCDFPTTENLSPLCDFPMTDFPLSENRTQQIYNYTKKKDIPPKAPQGADRLFDQFWAAYPKKRGKEAARKAWKKLSPDKDLCRVMAKALKWQKQSQDWLKDNGQYIPYPASWLNGRRWEDAPDKPDGTEERYI